MGILVSALSRALDAELLSKGTLVTFLGFIRDVEHDDYIVLITHTNKTVNKICGRDFPFSARSITSSYSARRVKALTPTLK